MEHYYTDEVNAQIIIKLLKENGIRKVVASPGTTNIPILESIQYDTFFEVYSAVDERSAAYIACGLAAESGETVVLSCTGATASRNYMPGLTEAYYRKLPLIALTSTNGNENIGNLVAQTIDRFEMPRDVVKLSVQLPVVKDSQDFWYCNHLTNKAILETTKDGGGPVHINLPTTYLGTFNTKELPKVNLVERIELNDEFPNIPSSKNKIAIFIGSHKAFSKEEIKAIETFCEKYGAVVLCDHTSSYNGKKRVLSSLVTANSSEGHIITKKISPDLIIHIGEISGDYATIDFLERSHAIVWRVSNDGKLKDKFKNIEYLFYCEELDFFLEMNHKVSLHEPNKEYYTHWKNQLIYLQNNIPELPFSNIWVSSKIANNFPRNSSIHFGILNSLRSNNFFDYRTSTRMSSNVGGFGIDGNLSTLIGASLAKPNELFFEIIGDLAFFYDMNVLGNRHVGNNLRILLINNSGGIEFKNYSHMGASLGEKADEFVAAANHFQGLGNGSPAKAWVESLGFKYISAGNKEEFSKEMKVFLDDQKDTSIVFECFTDSNAESQALKLMNSLDNKFTSKGKIKNNIKSHLSVELINKLKKIIRR